MCTSPLTGETYLSWDNSSFATDDEILDDPLLVIRSFGMELDKGCWEYARIAAGAEEVNRNFQKTLDETIPTPTVSCLKQIDHPCFAITQQNTPDGVEWQISRDHSFYNLLPIKQSTHLEESSTLNLDLLTQTFLESNICYWFRARSIVGNNYSYWSDPVSFTTNKPDHIKTINFQKTPENKYLIFWDKIEGESVEYFVFGSNSLDFIPSLYNEKQVQAITKNGDTTWVADTNLIAITDNPHIEVDGTHAFYRVISAKGQSYSKPSPLLYLWDENLATTRDVLYYHKNFNEATREVIPGYDPVSIPKYPCSQLCPPEAWELSRPYFLPENHPTRRILDRIFSGTRAIDNEKTLKNAGFLTPKQNEKFLVVSQHPRLKGYIIKAFLDIFPHPEWGNFIRRITGAEHLRNYVTQTGKEAYLKVPKKWLYPLPISPAPSTADGRCPKFFILIEQDMGLLSMDGNIHYWKRNMQPQMLNVLYHTLVDNWLIDSVYIDNIPISYDKRIAFVDTEHVNIPKDEYPLRLHLLLRNLSKENQAYWNTLIQTGGN